jgi:transcription elongation factor Elf1
MPKLTPEQKKNYLESPYHCPVCNAPNKDIEAGEWDGEIATQKIHCNGCGAEWGDIYKLIDVEITE